MQKHPELEPNLASGAIDSVIAPSRNESRNVASKCKGYLEQKDEKEKEKQKKGLEDLKTQKTKQQENIASKYNNKIQMDSDFEYQQVSLQIELINAALK